MLAANSRYASLRDLEFSLTHEFRFVSQLSEYKGDFMEKREYTLDERIAYYEAKIEGLKIAVKELNRTIDKDTKWLINLKTGREEMAREVLVDTIDTLDKK